MNYLHLKLLLLTLLLAGCVASSGPHLSSSELKQLPKLGGVLTVDTVLDGQYLLIADLQVPDGITLTILPGTEILVTPSDSTKINPEYLSKEIEILVRGQLQAVGTLDRPIRLLPVGKSNNEILWAGVELIGDNNSRLEHLRIEQAETGILCLGASPRISKVQILRSRYGIVLQQRSNPDISDSLLANGEAGLFCWDESAPVLQSNRITDHQEEGLYLGPKCRAKMVANQITGNDRGAVIPAGLSLATSNRLTGNRLNLLHYKERIQ